MRGLMNKRGELEKIVTSLPVLLGIFIFTILFVAGSYFVSLNTSWEAVPVNAVFSQGMWDTISTPVSYKGGVFDSGLFEKEYDNQPLLEVAFLVLRHGRSMLNNDKGIYPKLAERVAKRENSCLMFGSFYSNDPKKLLVPITPSLSSPNNRFHPLFLQSEVVKRHTKEGIFDYSGYQKELIEKCPYYGGIEDFALERYRNLGAVWILEVKKEIYLYGYYGPCLSVDFPKGCPLNAGAEVVK